jgi:hypothetical protein
MSWSFRSRLPMRRHPMRIVVDLLLVVASALVAAPGFSAQVYVQPTAALGAENDSNLNLDSGPHPSVQGYLANAGALFGIATPNSESTVGARVDYRNYPKDQADNRLEEYLDFRSDYTTARSHAAISGTIDHRDDFNAEFSSAYFNPINPIQPTNPSTGRAVTGETITSALLQPSYGYKFSPVIGADVSAIYQKVNYSPTFLDHSDFDFYQGNADLSWKFSQRSELSFGGFGSKYQSTQIASSATGAGPTVGLDTSWSPLLSTNATITYQHTNLDQSSPPIVKTSVNTWGGNASAVYKGLLSQYRLILSRYITPSGGGGVYVNDQAQFQYNRNLTERLAFTGAVIGLKSSQLPSNFNNLDRSYMQTAVDLKWMIRPTWFVQGGYQYAWQKYTQSPDGAANNRIFIRVGYQGLPPQR